MPDRSVSRKAPETFMTTNTVVVLCAIAVLVAILVFLESRIRQLSVHAVPHFRAFLDLAPFRDRASTVSSSKRHGNPISDSSLSV